jgi:hypothetical protein
MAEPHPKKISVTGLTLSEQLMMTLPADHVRGEGIDDWSVTPVSAPAPLDFITEALVVGGTTRISRVPAGMVSVLSPLEKLVWTT